MNKQEVIDKVTKYYNTSFEYINSSRDATNITTKKIIWKVLRDELKLSFSECGLNFSGGTHSNVLTTLKKFNGYIDTDKDLRLKYNDVIEYLFNAKMWRKKKLISEIKALYGDAIANTFIEITDDTELLNIEEWD